MLLLTKREEEGAVLISLGWWRWRVEVEVFNSEGAVTRREGGLCWSMVNQMKMGQSHLFCFFLKNGLRIILAKERLLKKWFPPLLSFKKKNKFGIMHSVHPFLLNDLLLFKVKLFKYII